MKSRVATKTAAIVATVALFALPAIAVPASAGAFPTAQPRKACSAYDREHFHGVTAHMPDGIKCLQVGEWCSHGPGFARAYREHGFVCEANGRLEES
jgi:hypothetical protein